MTFMGSWEIWSVFGRLLGKFAYIEVSFSVLWFQLSPSEISEKRSPVTADERLNNSDSKPHVVSGR